jgi:hypothetical protein
MPWGPAGEAWRRYVRSGGLDAEVIHCGHEVADHLHELASGCLADDPGALLADIAGDAPGIPEQFERGQRYRHQASQAGQYLAGRLDEMPEEMRPAAREVLGRLSVGVREAGGRLELPGTDSGMEAER